MRTTGYYWVKRGGTWLIGLFYMGDVWYLAGLRKAYQSTDFEEISNHKIEIK